MPKCIFYHELHGPGGTRPYCSYHRRVMLGADFCNCPQRTEIFDQREADEALLSLICEVIKAAIASARDGIPRQEYQAVRWAVYGGLDRAMAESAVRRAVHSG